MKKIFTIFLLAIALSACSTIVPTTTVTPTSTPIFRTPTPFPTITSFNSIKESPVGKFLFAAVSGGMLCSENCQCDVSEPIPPPFHFENGKLFLHEFDFGQADWADTRKSNNAIGFYNFWTMHETRFDYIKSFPFATQDSEFVINGMNEQGELFVQTNYGFVLLKPGDFIEREWVENTSTESCQILHSLEFTNFGFVEDSQVEISNDWWPFY